MSAFIDLTEFLSQPQRTGIQRVTGELCRYWPGGIHLTPVRVDGTGRLVPLPADTLTAIGEYFGSGREMADRALDRIRAIHQESESAAQAVDLSPDDVLLCPEVFYDPVRVNFYWNLPAAVRERCCFFVYDLLPLTHPEHFQPNVPHHIISRYFCLLRRIGQLAFDSRYTQKQFYSRFMRAPELKGHVFRLGSDGLGTRRPIPDTRSKQSFVALGTIEPRKNHTIILDALEPILQKVRTVELIFLGRMGWAPGHVRERIARFADTCPQFRLITDAVDGAAQEFVSNARAMIYASEVEGFGLPPVESLWLGTPVICSPHIPSIDSIGTRGTHPVHPMTTENLRAACVAFLHDDHYRDKLREARSLKLPNWQSFAKEIEEWIGRVQATPAFHRTPAQAGEGV